MHRSQRRLFYLGFVLPILCMNICKLVKQLIPLIILHFFHPQVEKKLLIPTTASPDHMLASLHFFFQARVLKTPYITRFFQANPLIEQCENINQKIYSPIKSLVQLVQNFLCQISCTSGSYGWYGLQLSSNASV